MPPSWYEEIRECISFLSTFFHYYCFFQLDLLGGKKKKKKKKKMIDVDKLLPASDVCNVM